MHYVEENVSTSCIAAAIARCCVEDCRVNNFTFQGFPSVEVVDELYELEIPDGHFQITLRYKERYSIAIMNRRDIFIAARLHNMKNSDYCRKLFGFVQPMITELECFKI